MLCWLHRYRRARHNMKAREAIIGWNDLDDGDPSSGNVWIGRAISISEINWNEDTQQVAAPVLKYQMRGGRNAECLLADVRYLVDDECLNPERIHRAFLAIDEYADLFIPPRAAS